MLNELEILARCLIYSYVGDDDIDDRMLTLENTEEKECSGPSTSVAVGV